MNTYRRDTVSDVPSLKVVQAKVWHSNSRQREREEKDEEKCCPRSFGDEDGKEKRFFLLGGGIHYPNNYQSGAGQRRADNRHEYRLRRGRWRLKLCFVTLTLNLDFLTTLL